MAQRGIVTKIRRKDKNERPIRWRKYPYLFLIVCEDAKTEPDYFSEYMQYIPKETIYLKPVGAGRDSKGVVERAIIERENLAKMAKREVDNVWVVFDKDDADENLTKSKRFNDAFQIASSENFNVAYSNEVFELWFLLHFKNVDETIALPRNDIYTQLREVFQSFPGYEDYFYDHSVIDYRTIEIVFKHGNRDCAIKRAQILSEFHASSLPINANPITKVHLLILDLLEWIKYYSYDPFR